MTLPIYTPVFVDLEVAGLGSIRARALTLSEAIELERGGIEEIPAILSRAIDGGGDDVETWLRSLPSTLITRVITAVTSIDAGGALPPIGG